MISTLSLLLFSACPPSPFEEIRARMEAIRTHSPEAVTFEDLRADCPEQVLPALLFHARDPSLRVRFRSLFELQSFPASSDVRDQCVTEIESRTEENLRIAVQCLLALHDSTLQPAVSELTSVIASAGMEMNDEPCLAVQLLTRLHSLGSTTAIQHLHELRDRGETLLVDEEDDELLSCSRVALARLCDDHELAILLDDAERATAPQDLVPALQALAETRRGEAAHVFLRHVGNTNKQKSVCVLHPRVNQAAGYGLALLLGMTDVEDAFDIDRERLAEILEMWER